MSSDDHEVKDEEELLRRARPFRNCIGQDLSSRRYYLLPGALTVDADGMSVYRQKLLSQRQLPTTIACNRDDQWLFSFLAECPRRVGWMVRHCEDESDPVVGFAHSSVLTAKMPPTKREKILLREAIAEVAILVHQPELTGDEEIVVTDLGG